ncbi:helix-turn-helix transcriptional regulator [Saccharopolyspora indica]|uniref:helix-turn-helix domain-containing protein n=1 Tax=Saccharopolyspora indica TaxID=1229659 RepID=UPI0022EB9BAA|nr:helix-turn-helix transcriptional regulator [Saccharopolyspora indica]MDA3644338.1 helix-turn-helix transcriptional regulator [Saccharopolyspora indica]
MHPTLHWNLRTTAARRGIWKSITLRNLLAERGYHFSAAKMSSFWTGQFKYIKPADLAAFCQTLDCRLDELLTFHPAQSTPVEPAKPGTSPDLWTTARVTPER